MWQVQKEDKEVDGVASGSRKAWAFGRCAAIITKVTALEAKTAVHKIVKSFFVPFAFIALPSIAGLGNCYKREEKICATNCKSLQIVPLQSHIAKMQIFQLCVYLVCGEMSINVFKLWNSLSLSCTCFQHWTWRLNFLAIDFSGGITKSLHMFMNRLHLQLTQSPAHEDKATMERYPEACR